MADVTDAFTALILSQTAITDLIGDGASPLSVRFFPNGSEKNPTLPCVVYIELSAIREQDFEGPRGSARSRFQFDILGKTYAEVKAVAEAFRTTLDGYIGVVSGIDFLSTKLENQYNGFEEDEEFHRLTQEYIFYHSEAS